MGGARDRPPPSAHPCGRIRPGPSHHPGMDSGPRPISGRRPQGSPTRRRRRGNEPRGDGCVLHLGAVRCGAVRCGAVRCGAVRCGAVTDGLVGVPAFCAAAWKVWTGQPWAGRVAPRNPPWRLPSSRADMLGGGWGLPLVDALADQWGSVRNGVRTSVWIERRGRNTQPDVTSSDR
jgi:hypothetical protein